MRASVSLTLGGAVGRIEMIFCLKTLLDEVISDLLLWEPKHGARKRGRPALTYVDQLQNDTGLSIAELKNIMENRKEWMKLVNGVRVRSK